MPKITFLPNNIVADCEDGDSVFDVGKANGIDIETTCVGQATCGLCRIKIVEGEQFTSEFNEAEEKHLGNVYFLTKVRLSCQTRVSGGDVTVELAPKKRKKQKK